MYHSFANNTAFNTYLACNGDSGGPLIIAGNDYSDAVQVGIVSYGFECDPIDVPSVYAEVAYFYQWIQEQLDLYPMPSEPTTTKITDIATKRNANFVIIITLFCLANLQ